MDDGPIAAPIWKPDQARIAGSNLTLYMNWLRANRGLDFTDYDKLWQWSVENLADFWESLWQFFDIRASKPYQSVLANASMPGAQWFVGAELNFIDQIFRHGTDAKPAVLYASETDEIQALSWRELEAAVASVAGHLRACGIRRGDRVVAFSPNTPETLIAFLATASIGAIWSICSPDMGVQSVLDRFRQIEPAAIFVVQGIHYNGKSVDRSKMVNEIIAALPSLREVIVLPDNSGLITERAASPRHSDWSTILARPGKLEIEQVPFDHPLWVVYSSGTTGLPKPIVHGHGGILVETLKGQILHSDIKPSDVFHWYSSTGWIMWNSQIGALVTGATIAIYNGSPSWPDWGVLWRFAGKAGVTFFGAGAAFYASCMKAEIRPTAIAPLERLHSIGSTGSPLSEDGYAWIYREFGSRIWLNPVSGGTDFAGAFVGGCVLLPIYSGEMQCRCLGANIRAFDEKGQSLVDSVGELVCVSPIPSMPLFLWNDKNGQRYHDSYFDMYPGLWRHGDWIRITSRGGAIIYGRSDATINRYGLRLGTAEIYRAVEELPEIMDSLVVDLEVLGRDSYMPLFVVLREGARLDEELKGRINAAIRASVSARFIPNDVFQVAEVPRTLSGKKLEVPVKKILLGHAVEKVANPGTMSNPQSLAWFAAFAKNRAAV